MIRRLLPLAGVFFAILSTTARAEGSTLTITGTDRRTGQTCWTTTTNRLEYDFGGGNIGDCPSDMVQLTIEGAIFLPDAAPQLAFVSDDGLRVWIDGELIYDYWNPRSCWGEAVPTQLTAGAHEIRVEWYEDYGGACLHIFELTASGESRPITIAEPPQTTTTTSLEPETTTSAAETTTTLPEPSTTLPEPTTTTIQTPSSTSIPSTTTTTEIPNQTTTTTSTLVATSTSIESTPESSISPTTTINATEQNNTKSNIGPTLVAGASNGLAPGVTPESQRAIVAVTITMLASPTAMNRKQRK